MNGIIVNIWCEMVNICNGCVILFNIDGFLYKNFEWIWFYLS